jgi:hypothetical protein
MARTRSRVEHFAFQGALGNPLLDHRLRFADIPRRQRGQPIQRPLVTVELVEILPTNVICHAQHLAAMSALTASSTACLQS